MRQVTQTRRFSNDCPEYSLKVSCKHFNHVCMECACCDQARLNQVFNMMIIIANL